MGIPDALSQHGETGAVRAARRLAGALAVVLVAASCTVEPRTDRGGAQAVDDHGPRREVITPPGVARLPVFASAIRSGDFIFLSGAIGALPGVNPPQVVEGGIEAEAHQAMQNIETVLAAAGAGWGDVVKCTVFLENMEDYAAFNEVYASYFDGDPPARSALGADGLALGALVEVECVAAAPEGS